MKRKLSSPQLGEVDRSSTAALDPVPAECQWQDRSASAQHSIAPSYPASFTSLCSTRSWREGFDAEAVGVFPDESCRLQVIAGQSTRTCGVGISASAGEPWRDRAGQLSIESRTYETFQSVGRRFESSTADQRIQGLSQKVRPLVLPADPVRGLSAAFAQAERARRLRA